MTDSADKRQPGPWRPLPWGGYGSHYWTIVRDNPRFANGVEIMMTAQGNPRRFKTEAAAQAAISKELAR